MHAAGRRVLKLGEGRADIGLMTNGVGQAAVSSDADPFDGASTTTTTPTTRSTVPASDAVTDEPAGITAVVAGAGGIDLDRDGGEDGDEGGARRMRILFASAEFDPLVKVGGLGEAGTGLVRALRAEGCLVDVVLPDYGDWRLGGAVETPLDVPDWAGPAVARTGALAGVGPVTLIRVPGIARPHPYVDPATGAPWPDNDQRFFAFGAAVAALVRERRPDVVQLNDWHTATVPAFLPPGTRTVLTVHNLAFQGHAPTEWADRFGQHRASYLHEGETNALAGALRLADRVVAVSPTYAREILTEPLGSGLSALLAGRGDALRGIRNGIDTDHWDPRHDPMLPAGFGPADPTGKFACQQALLARTTIGVDESPLIGVVCRLTHQKGVDLVLALAEYLDTLPGRLVLLGEGDPDLVARAARMAAVHHRRMFFFARYEESLAHLLVAGSDLLLVPSRFEPCGLTQMQALAYGTLPVVTGVGGLRDTVIDADRDPDRGNGFVAATVTLHDLIDAVHRATRTWHQRGRRLALQKRGMETDWSWGEPARRYVALYQELVPAGVARGVAATARF